MPRRTRSRIETDIQRERWFIVQCLARNKEYMKLYADHEEWTQRWIFAKNLWGGQSRVPGTVRRWQTDSRPVAPVPRPLRARFARMFRGHPQRDAAFAWLEKARNDPAERSRLDEVVRTLNPTPYASEADAGVALRALSRRAIQRFGVFHILDPRPYAEKDVHELEPLDFFLFDSMRLIKNLVITRAEHGPIDDSRTRGSSRSDFEDARFASFCDGEIDLILTVDVRHSSARLRYDFERILKKIDRLKERGRLRRMPPRPRTALWKTYLRVWDLREQGRSNAYVAIHVFHRVYRNAPARARTMAHQHYEAAKFWISLDWARTSSVRGTP